MRFRQLHAGGGTFWPEPSKQGYSYRINFKFATNNGMDNTSKRAKFKVIGCSTFRDMTSQKFSFRKGTSHNDSIFLPPGIEQNSKKSLFCLKTSFLSQNSTPFVFPWFSSKTKKFICSIFRDVSFQKQLQQPPWLTDFAEILPKYV